MLFSKSLPRLENLHVEKVNSAQVYLLGLLPDYNRKNHNLWACGSYSRIYPCSQVFWRNSVKAAKNPIPAARFSTFSSFFLAECGARAVRAVFAQCSRSVRRAHDAGHFLGHTCWWIGLIYWLKFYSWLKSSDIYHMDWLILGTVLWRKMTMGWFEIGFTTLLTEAKGSTVLRNCGKNGNKYIRVWWEMHVDLIHLGKLHMQ